MPTRSTKRLSAGRVHEAAQPPKQVHFPARNRRVSSRNLSLSTPRTRQQTLTQIDFVTRIIPDEEGIDLEYIEQEEEKPRESKRRKTAHGPPTSRVQTRAARWQAIKHENNENENLQNQLEGLVKEESSARPIPSVNTAMPPPKTPQRQRKTEVPSSTSPDTPLSTQSRRSISRSPLNERSTNLGALLVLYSATGQTTSQAPKLEVRNSYDENESNLSLKASQIIRLEIDDSGGEDESEDAENPEDDSFNVGLETQAIFAQATAMPADILSTEDDSPSREPNKPLTRQSSISNHTVETPLPSKATNSRIKNQPNPLHKPQTDHISESPPTNPHTPRSISEEASAQLTSNLSHFTQTHLAPLLYPHPHPTFPIPSSQATTVDTTQTLTNHLPTTPHPHSSPSLLIPSSSPFSTDSPPNSQYEWDGKPLTDSQLLPASLMQDSVLKAPVWGEGEEEEVEWGLMVEE